MPSWYSHPSERLVGSLSDLIALRIVKDDGGRSATTMADAAIS